MLKIRLSVGPDTTIYELRKFAELASERPGETLIGVEGENGFWDLEIDYSTHQARE